jgi:hypothetical protein
MQDRRNAITIEERRRGTGKAKLCRPAPKKPEVGSREPIGALPTPGAIAVTAAPVAARVHRAKDARRPGYAG